MFNLFRKKKKENTSVEKEELKKTEEKEETKTTPETKKEEEVETETGYLDGRPAYQVSEVVGRYCPECGWEE